MRKLWIAIATLLSFTACTKIESTTIGSGLIPPIDGVNTLDTTLEVITDNSFSTLSDSVKVDKGDDHVIGVVNDLSFGQTIAETYFELKPTNYKFGFTGQQNSLIADSAVLVLSYRGVWGDSMQAQRWEVRELGETIKNDTIFAVSKSFSKGALLGSKTVNITTFNDNYKDSFEVATNQIRIKLSSEFASKVIKQFDSSGNGAYASDSLFREHFKGFYVSPAGPEGNALVRVNLLDTNTKLALYYRFKTSDTSPLDTAVSYFRFSTGASSAIPVSASGNHIIQNRQGSEMQSYLTNNKPNDDRVFIQTSPGNFATVKVPGFESLTNRIIHRAELMVIQDPVWTAQNSKLTPPNFLLLSWYDSANKRKNNIPNDFIIDQSGGPNISTFGGSLINRELSPGVSVKGYFFDISRYVQGIITRKDPVHTLVLSAPSNDSLRYSYPYPLTTASTTYQFVPSSTNNVAIGRVVLAGGGTATGSPYRMRVRIIYSKI